MKVWETLQTPVAPAPSLPPGSIPHSWEQREKWGKHMNEQFTHIKSSSMQTVSKFIHCGEMQFKAIPIYHFPLIKIKIQPCILGETMGNRCSQALLHLHSCKLMLPLQENVAIPQRAMYAGTCRGRNPSRNPS